MRQDMAEVKWDASIAENESVIGGSPDLAEIRRRTRDFLFILRMTAEKASLGGEDFVGCSDRFPARLDALSRAHMALLRKQDSSLELRECIEEELRLELLANEPRLKLQGADIALTGKAAYLMSLAIHELAARSLDQGALSYPGGDLKISWRILANRLRFEWREATANLQQSATLFDFGKNLIEHVMATHLNATSSLNFASDGMRCVMTIPLSVELSPAKRIARTATPPEPAIASRSMRLKGQSAG